jgi:hypothetical protein
LKSFAAWLILFQEKDAKVEFLQKRSCLFLKASPALQKLRIGEVFEKITYAGNPFPLRKGKKVTLCSENPALEALLSN